MKRIMKLENITKIYDTKVEKIKVLDDINLEIFEKDFIAIIGKSGSGKTSLLNILGLLDNKYVGNVDIVEEKEFNLGFVFQFHHLLSEFTALENIMLAYLAKNNDFNRAREKAEELLEIVDMKDRKNFYPSELSGGQKQRVAIARALINNPKIILADEPTGNLDEENSKKINELFIKINKEKGQSIIIVTHSMELAKIADKIYKIENSRLKVIK